MKRKAAAAGRTVRTYPLTPHTSRFVDCPACQRSVPFASINMHLDTQCRPGDTAGLPKTPGTGLPTTLQQTGSQHQHQHQQQEQQQRGINFSSSSTVQSLSMPAQAMLPQQPRLVLRQQDAVLTTPFLRHPGKAPVQPASEEPAQLGQTSETSASASASLPFWRRSPAAAIAFNSGGGKRGLVTAEALFAVSCELLTNFLPPDLSEQVLRQLMADQPGWKRMEWWFTRPDNGKAQEGRPLEQHAVMSSTTSCHYVMQVTAVCSLLTAVCSPPARPHFLPLCFVAVACRLMPILQQRAALAMLSCLRPPAPAAAWMARWLRFRRCSRQERWRRRR